MNAWAPRADGAVTLEGREEGRRSGRRGCVVAQGDPPGQPSSAYAQKPGVGGLVGGLFSGRGLVGGLFGGLVGSFAGWPVSGRGIFSGRAGGRAGGSAGRPVSGLFWVERSSSSRASVAAATHGLGSMACRASPTCGQPVGAACRTWLAAAVWAAAEKEGVLVGAADVVKAAKRFANATAKGAGAGEVLVEGCAGGGAASRAADGESTARVPSGATAGEGRFPGGARGWGRCGSSGPAPCFCARGSHD